MDLLTKIATGVIVLDDVVDTPTTFDNTYFFPNATATDPIFSMESRF